MGGNALKTVPGSNDFVQDKHTLFKDVFALLALVGKPRHGYIFDQLRVSRSHFKLAVRYCMRHEKELRAKSLADKLVKTPHSMNYEGLLEGGKAAD